MKNKKVIRLFIVMLAVVLCMTAFSVAAFAGDGDGYYYTEEPVARSKDAEGQPLTWGVTPCWWMIIIATSSLSS